MREANRKDIRMEEFLEQDLYPIPRRRLYCSDSLQHARGIPFSLKSDIGKVGREGSVHGEDPHWDFFKDK